MNVLLLILSLINLIKSEHKKVTKDYLFQINAELYSTKNPGFHKILISSTVFN